MTNATLVEQGSDARNAPELDRLVQEIGVARFVGRINAGVIDASEGYQAVERFMAREHDRPLLSRLSHALLGRSDTFEKRGS
jgi:hypothetical protein